jgi:hypothetical protein
LLRDLSEQLRSCRLSRGCRSLPEIALKDLSIVAFVQDDADNSILHALAVPVK